MHDIDRRLLRQTKGRNAHAAFSIPKPSEPSEPSSLSDGTCMSDCRVRLSDGRSARSAFRFLCTKTLVLSVLIHVTMPK